MKAISVILAVAIAALPFAAAIDLPERGFQSNNRVLEDPWHPVEGTEKPDTPWWERTSLDLNRNGVSDVLDPYITMTGEDSMESHVIVSFGREVENDDIIFLEAMGFHVSSRIDNIDAVVLGYVPTFRIPDILDVPGIIFVEPLGNPVLFSDIATPTVRAKGSEMYSPDTAWDLDYQGRGISVAVIDTGIDDEHPSLRGKFLGGVDMTKPDNLPFLYPQDGSYNPDDIQGHGSTCSGIATGTGAPEGEYQGTAPEARLVDIRIGTKIGYAPGEFWVGAVSDPHLKDGTLRGIDWGIEHRNDQWGSGEYQGIDVFSISWGVDVGSDSDGTDAYSRLLDRAVESGVIVVNAAGNDGPSNTGFHGLAASSKSIVVAATDDRNTMGHEDDVVAFYSSRGPRDDNNDGNPFDELTPDIAAPGTNITNMQPDTTRFTGDASNNGYGNRGSGTSYATPTVAGVVALILEANPDLKGNTELVLEIMKYTAERMKPPTYPDLDPFWEVDFGYGMVDAYDSVRLAESVEEAGNIDPDLQAHILNASGMDVRPYFGYNMSLPAVISGYGWSRGSAFDGTEYRIDSGPWMPVDSQSNGTFNPWEVELSGLSTGDHTVYVRSTGGNMESLMSWIHIHVTESRIESEGGIGGGFLLPVAILFAIAGIVAGIFIWLRSRKSSASG
ncbi:MAG: S8 family peptidase [Thermoplasmatota archaeon]